MCISVLLHEGANLRWTAKYSPTVNVLLEEVRPDERLWIPRSDVLFTLDMNNRHDGYRWILCLDK